MILQRLGMAAAAVICGLALLGGPCTAAQTPKPAKPADSVKKADPADKGDDKETKPVWTADLSNVTIPQKPATGRLHGETFTLDRAELQQGILVLRQGTGFFADLEFKLFLFVNSPAQLEGQSLEILDEENPPVKTVPHVYIGWKPDPKALPKSKSWTGDYVIKIKFGQVKNGRLPGQIYLCLPDMKQSFVAGTFEAILK